MSEEHVTDPVSRAVEHLELLSESAREAVLDSMAPEMAERIRTRMASTPDRPHGQFSQDVVTRRRMLREMSERIHASNSAQQVQALDAVTSPTTSQAQTSFSEPVPAPVNPQVLSRTVSDPLSALRTLHPAAIARAMQGERAEAWAIVLDHLEVRARGALQLYLDEQAQIAIQDARERQAELAQNSPEIARTIEAAIARTVVPRALREHQHLLSSTQITWDNPIGV